MQDELISREATLKPYKGLNDEDTISVWLIRKNIEQQPSVTPQEPKTGHWILTSDDDYEYCTCSECGYQNGENWMIGSQIKYCQECGARMKGDIKNND